MQKHLKMPHLYVAYCNSEITAIVTKGYEEIVQETLTEVLQSFHEKIAVTRVTTNSTKCCKFQLKIRPNSNNFGYPSTSTKECVNLEEFHIVLLEEMQKINWQHLMTSSTFNVENKSGSWTFYSPMHRIPNGVL